MRKHAVLLTAAAIIISLITGVQAAEKVTDNIFEWSELPTINDPLGFGGPFAGVSNDMLVIAGGAHFPEKVWGEGSKVWRGDIRVLDDENGQWQTLESAFHRPLAYGVSLTTPYGILTAGGSDADRAYRDVYLYNIEKNGGDLKVDRRQLPDLPAPRAASSGGLIGNTVYICCGQTESAETEVTATIWKLELPADPADNNAWDSLAWETLTPLPGPPRSQAPSAVQNGKLYVFSGFTLIPGEDGSPARSYLSDSWCYNPSSDSWKQLSDCPIPVIAAPAIGFGDSHIFVFSGSDGTKSHLVDVLKDKWPGFTTDVLSYHTITDTWIVAGSMPYGMVTTTAVNWRGKIVLPSGEIKPRIRTNRVPAVEVTGKQAGFGLLNTIFLSVYLASLVGMGFYFSRREKTTEDFFIGGRRVPWWAAGLSIFGTQLSSISFMAIPAKVYATNWLYFVGFICIVLVQPIVVWFYLPFFRRLNITSAYDYLERRFNLAVRMLGSLSFVLFQLGRMTIVLFLPALALSAVTGIDIFVCIIVMGVLATLYTVLGGIEAVIWTDVLQVIVLIGGALLSLVIIVLNVDGGIGSIIHTGMTDGKFKFVELGWDITAPVLWVIFIGGMFQNMVSYSADQAVIQRYLTTKDEKAAAKAIWTNGIMILPIALVWFSLGTALYAFYKAHPASLDPSLITDQTFPLFIAQELPDGIVGLVIAGLFAASMSTVDSSLNSISTVLITDFYSRFKTVTDDSKSLSLARLITVVLGVCATAAALWMATSDNLMSLWDIYLAVLGLLMGSLTGLFALGIFTEKTNGKGALIGAVGGAAVLYYVQHYTDTHFYIYAAVGISACFIIGYISSLLLPSKQETREGLTIYSIGNSPSE